MTTPDNPCMYSQTIHGWWGDPPMGKACNFGGGGASKMPPESCSRCCYPTNQRICRILPRRKCLQTKQQIQRGPHEDTSARAQRHLYSARVHYRVHLPAGLRAGNDGFESWVRSGGCCLDKRENVKEKKQHGTLREKDDFFFGLGVRCSPELRCKNKQICLQILLQKFL